MFGIDHNWIAAAMTKPISLFASELAIRGKLSARPKEVRL